MQRYLMNIAYIGTKYKGATKNLNVKDHLSIEDVLNQGLKEVRQIKNVELNISSRTDAGVHATNTTVHIDLDRYILPHVITNKLNSVFDKWHEQIRVLKTTPVKCDFDSRRDAINRTYLYRFAVAKNKVPHGVSPKLYKEIMFIPIEESFRCYFVLNEGFDIEKTKQAAKQMEGIHDFRTFMKASKEQRTFHPRFCYRNMKSIEVRPGLTIATSFNREKTLECYDFWDVEFKCRAYFYRQIRNMVGTLIAAGNGRIKERDVYEMLTIPSKYSWRHKIQPAPSCGLYLTNVEYPDELFVRNETTDDDSNSKRNSNSGIDSNSKLNSKTDNSNEIKKNIENDAISEDRKIN